MLPISRSSEYAIRAMTYLARRVSTESSAVRYSLTRDLAKDLAIPAPFLGKCLQPLVARGILQSQRGRNGGFRLAKPAASISLHQIIDSQEHLDRARQCFLGQAECTDERACPLHDFWKASADAFHRRLRETTLADMVRFCDARPTTGYPEPLG